MLGELGESLEVGEQHRHLPLRATELGELRLALQVLGERRRDVRPEQAVDATQLTRGRLEHRSLVGREPVCPELFEHGLHRPVLGERGEDRAQGVGRAFVHPLERRVEVHASERRRDRGTAAVPDVGGPQYERKRRGHHQVPLPPGDVPAAGEGDRDERLRQQHPGRRGRGGQQIVAPAVEAEVADRREAVEGAAGDRDGDQLSPVVLRGDRLIEGWDLRKRHRRPEHEQREEPAAEEPPVPEHGGGVGRRELERRRCREACADQEPDRCRDIEAGVRALEQLTGVARA